MKADNGGGQSGQQVVLRDSQSTRPRLACWELEGAGKGGAAGSLSQRNRAPGWGERKKKKKKPDHGEKGRRKRKEPAGVGEEGDSGGGMFRLFQAAGDDLSCRA